MRLGMMQPYFFPYIGYFSLMRATDRWVIFDTAQYIRRGWVNRNRVLSDGRDPWKYVRVPVVHSSRETSILDTLVDMRQSWIPELINQLDAYRRRRAPFYGEVRDWLIEVLEIETGRLLQSSADGQVLRLCDLLVALLKATCGFLEIPVQLTRFSELQLPIPDTAGPGDWALETARLLGAGEYINPPGGRELFSAEAFRASGIQLTFLQHRLPVYAQGHHEFIPGLSVIDVMMWNSQPQIQQMLNEYDLTSGH
ncbi:MAG: WbqC family protein [Planctomyces sp.]|nr:WbqC family protein [Planctomyces sp.]